MNAFGGIIAHRGNGDPKRDKQIQPPQRRKGRNSYRAERRQSSARRPQQQDGSCWMSRSARTRKTTHPPCPHRETGPGTQCRR